MSLVPPLGFRLTLPVGWLPVQLGKLVVPPAVLAGRIG